MAPRTPKQREWHIKNAERVRQKNKEWLERNGGKEYTANVMREWRKRNPEHSKAKQGEYDQRRWVEKRDYMVSKMIDWKTKNPEKWTALNRKSDLKRYGITADEFVSMSKAQGDVCAICSGKQTAKRHPNLSVDHDHDTGEVRALLCVKCNTGLGMFRDSPELLEKAALYLRKHKKSEAA